MKRVDEVIPNLGASVVINTANSATITNTIDLLAQELVGIFIPSGFSGTTITLNSLPTLAGTAFPVQNGAGSSSAYTITTTAGNYVPIDNLAIPAGIRFLQLVCGSSQSNGTNFILALRNI